MQRKFGVRLLGAAALVAAAVAVSAHAIAGEADWKYRQATMKAVGGHMAAMAANVKGEVKHADHLKMHAAAMAGLAKAAPDVFMKGSEGGKAKADVWSKPEDFKKAMAAFQTAAANLEKASMGDDKKAFGAAFGALGKTCKGCHDSFKSEK